MSMSRDALCCVLDASTAPSSSSNSIVEYRASALREKCNFIVCGDLFRCAFAGGNEAAR